MMSQTKNNLLNKAKFNVKRTIWKETSIYKKTLASVSLIKEKTILMILLFSKVINNFTWVEDLGIDFEYVKQRCLAVLKLKKCDDQYI